MKTLIVVPARFNSTRFPGKPLAKINGISMVRRTAQVAALAADTINNCGYVIATDDERIKAHCEEHIIPHVMTPSDLKTGSDRALSAAKALGGQTGDAYEYIINLQGDAPFTPVSSITLLAEAIKEDVDVATPYIQLSWGALDELRRHKKDTPFSGTTVIIGSDDRAIWFSKNIIPAIRQNTEMRDMTSLSPVNRHIGLYAYTRTALETFTSCPESHYEKLEGLEQLRLLENDMSIACVRVEPPAVTMGGIDSPTDIDVAEALIAQHGDPFQCPVL